MNYRYRPSVSLSVPPERADLDCWGLDVGGEWWALVVWGERVSPTDGGHPHNVACAAWVYAGTVTQTQAAMYYLHVPRIKLGAEPAEWPPPRNREHAAWDPAGGYYFGALEHGEKPVLPPDAGRAWGDYSGSAYG